MHFFILHDLQKALKERGIDTMLEDARESNRENDAEHMKRRCRLLKSGVFLFFIS